MMEFDVQAMSCGHCVGRVTEAVKSLDPQARVEVDLPSRKVRVDATVPPEKVAAALTEAGYPPE